MKWSWKITRIAGIDVYIHATFLLLLIWFGYLGWQEHGTIFGVGESVAFIVILFACIVFHELGHALTARRFGIKTRDITLLPIGGVAALESMPEKPIHEIAVALAGPAVNVVIAALIWYWLYTHDALLSLDGLLEGEYSFLSQLMVVNIFLAAFNLIPAFPMDGGRVLRAILAFGFNRARATTYAARIGQIFSVLFGLFGILSYNPMLILVAIFLWFAAVSEATMENVKYMLKQVTIRQAMLKEFHVLSARDTLARAVDLTLAGNQRDFPVIENGRFSGLLTQRNLLQMLAEKGRDTEVHEAVLSDIAVVDINESATELLQRMQQEGLTVVVVKEHGNPVGLVTIENILELMAFRKAMGARANN